MNRKIPIGLTIAIAALAAAIAFFAGSSLVQDKINDTLIDLNEKQAMYAKLNELDSCIRTNKGSETIDETALMEGICRGYIEGLNNTKFTYMSAEEFALSDFAKDKSDNVIKLSDGSAVIIQDTTDPSETN